MKLTRFQRPDLWSWGHSDDQITSLRDQINRLFEPFNGFGASSELFSTWSPAIDLYEDKDSFIVRAELPGMKKEDLDISLHGDGLTITGERKEETPQNGEVSRAERFFGRFQRSVTLPKPVEVSKVKASYQDGVLQVRLPKTEEAKPRQIKVDASKD